jgi:Leucine-rich repeat (LRR) protein
VKRNASTRKESIEAKMIFWLLVFLIVSCRQKQDIQIDESQFDREGKLKYADSVNMENLRISLQDSLHVRNFTLMQFLHDTIPSSIFTLRNLEDLSIGFTYLRQVPPEICNLERLRILDLSQNKLTSVDNILCLKHLEYLELLGNKLTGIPENFGRLHNLEFLDISNNDFSHGIEGSFPEKLREIRIGNANLTSFPMQLLKLKNLERLYLSDNPGLIKIPEDIKNLVRLRELTLTDTGITEQQVEQLKALLPGTEIYFND